LTQSIKYSLCSDNCDDFVNELFSEEDKQATHLRWMG